MDLSRRRRAALAGSIAAALLLLTTPGHAQPAPGDYTDDPARPAGRRGERIQQVLDAVNSGERAPIEALVKDAFGGPFREIPARAAPRRARRALRPQPRPGLLRRATLHGRSPEGPGGGDREEPAHRGLAGALVHVRRHAGGAHHRPADPAGAAAEGRPPAPAAHRRPGEGRARRVPRSPGGGGGVLGHGAPGPRRPGGLRGRPRDRRAQPRRADAPRQQAQPGLDGQDVHGGGDRPARGRGQALLPGPRRRSSSAGRAGRRPISRRCASSTC